MISSRTCLVGVALVAALGGGPVALALADGDPLAEAAKKEQARREPLRKAGAPEQTFTEEDLANTKGKLANEPGAPIATDAAKNKLPSPKATLADQKEPYWHARVAQARGRVEEAERQRDLFQRMVRFGQPAWYDENGQKVKYSNSRLKEMADAADASAASARTALENVLEEGRRAGALPGWLR